MAFYTQIVARVSEMPSYRVEGCVRINLRPLLAAICRHSREWVVKLGQFLSASTKELNSDFDRIVSVGSDSHCILHRDFKIVELSSDFIFRTTSETYTSYHETLRSSRPSSSPFSPFRTIQLTWRPCTRTSPLAMLCSSSIISRYEKSNG
jgi:hypothetical protein